MSVKQIVMAAAGLGGAAEATYIEDVFSTYLYTGNGSTQTITNGIDLAGEGGMVWTKYRTGSSAPGGNHVLIDSARGITGTPCLFSDLNFAAGGNSNYITSLNSDGYTLGTAGLVNYLSNTLASWTFRKAEKFFDVVTYTGNGANRTISHNLGSVPGCIIVKRTDTTGDWQVYHRANTAAPETDYLVLNTTAATADSNTRWNDTLPTDSVFSLGTEATVNANGGTYVAYLFAHDAGGFGDDGSENVISCGSFTTDGSGYASVNLGYEPQWVLVKRTDSTGNWNLNDNMRGMPVDGNGARLFPNLSNAESVGIYNVQPNATGFSVPVGFFGASNTCIYIAIRRGPMKTPTSGTEVFSPQFQGSGTTATSPTFNAGFVTDMLLRDTRGGGSPSYPALGDRLRGASPFLTTSSTAAETASTTFKYDSMTGFYNPSGSATTDIIGWMFQRAPGFFDVVCYTGNASYPRNINHNLGKSPEMVIIKARSSATYGWGVHHKDLGFSVISYLENTIGTASQPYFLNAVSDTTFTLG